MQRKYRKSIIDGFKFCNRCDKELPSSPEFFLRDKSRCDGLAYECRVCHSLRKRGKDRRKERWRNMTPEQKVLRRASQKKYSITQKGRACFLRKAYERIDSCNFTTEEIVGIITKPCTYCGTTTRNRGLDRIDNNLPHIKGNVVTACTECNFARGDRFSMEEMKRIGAIIREIMRDRLQKVTGYEEHL